MGSAPWVSDVSFTPASPADARKGLVGFLSVTIDGTLRLDGLTLRLTRRGHYRITLPRRRGHPIVRPLSPGGTHALETQILAALGLEAAP